MNERTRRLLDRLIEIGEEIETYPDDDCFSWIWEGANGCTISTYIFGIKPDEPPRLQRVRYYFGDERP